MFIDIKESSEMGGAVFGSIFAHRTLIFYLTTVISNADVMKAMSTFQLMKLLRN